MINGRYGVEKSVGREFLSTNNYVRGILLGRPGSLSEGNSDIIISRSLKI